MVSGVERPGNGYCPPNGSGGVPIVATPAERFADVMDHNHTRDARDPLRKLIPTTSDRSDT